MGHIVVGGSGGAHRRNEVGTVVQRAEGCPLEEITAAGVVDVGVALHNEGGGVPRVRGCWEVTHRGKMAEVPQVAAILEGGMV